MPHLTSTEVAGRIEELYGAPLKDLESEARAQPPGMLSALLGLRHELALAEHSITAHRDQVARLTHPDQNIGRPEVSHLLNSVRRLAEAVAVRDVQAQSAAAVLQSLVSTPAPPPPSSAPATATASAVPAVPASTSPGPPAARSR